MSSRFPLVLAIVVIMTMAAMAEAVERVCPIYAYCVEVGVPGRNPRPLAEQATMLHELGYDGIGLELNAHIGSSLKTLDSAGLQCNLVWTPVNLDPAKGPAYGPWVPDAIRKLKGRPVVVSVVLGGLRPGDPQGMQPAVTALRELGDVAAEAGLRISIYNHSGCWAERLPFIVKVVRQANHPQVGFNFNLCHWLMTDAAGDYRPLLRENVDKLFVVAINGASVGSKSWTNGLIRPLDEGDFDNRELLCTLRKVGYHGPIGLMCFGVPGDTREHLTRSMKAWRELNLPRTDAK